MFVEVEVPHDAPEDPEPMGTKNKFWFQHPEMGRCLFKASRVGHGEDGTEKIAAELAAAFGHSSRSLRVGNLDGAKGVVSPSPDGLQSLIAGNELLREIEPSYPGAEHSRQIRKPAHTVERVLRAIQEHDLVPPLNVQLPSNILTAGDLFVGYLMLDALIGNTDRHDENWAAIQHTDRSDHPRSLAPTHDDASSLGQSTPDRVQRLG